MVETPVKVKVKSTMLSVATEEQMTEQYRQRENVSEVPYNKMVEIEEEATETIEYTTNGVFKDDDGLCVLSYFEPDEIGLGKSTAVITYCKKTKTVATIARNGALSYSMILDTDNPECVSQLSFPEGKVDVTIHANKVYNTLRDGNGSILLDFNILQFGSVLQRNKLFIEVRNG